MSSLILPPIREVIELDDIDRLILRELQQDSRRSFTKIAQQVGVSTATVSERVRRLMSKGIICGYTTILNTTEMGMVTLIAKIKTKQGYSVEEVGSVIADMAECCCVHHVTGEFDLLVISKCAGYDKCGDIIEAIKRVDGVESVEAELVLKTLKEELKVQM